jgi:hypothetical protein
LRLLSSSRLRRLVGVEHASWRVLLDVFFPAAATVMPLSPLPALRWPSTRRQKPPRTSSIRAAPSTRPPPCPVPTVAFVHQHQVVAPRRHPQRRSCFAHLIASLLICRCNLDVRRARVTEPY